MDNDSSLADLEMPPGSHIPLKSRFQNQLILQMAFIPVRTLPSGEKGKIANLEQANPLSPQQFRLVRFSSKSATSHSLALRRIL